MMAAFQVSVFADQATQDIVNEFNAMNPKLVMGQFVGQGYLFKSETNTGLYTKRTTVPGTSDVRLVGEQRLNNSGTDTPDLSGYKIGTTANNGTGDNFNFQTFCVAPAKYLYEEETTAGILNYNNNMTQTQGGKVRALTLGAAYLYMKFADGSLFGYQYTYSTARADSAVLLQDAIWYLLDLKESMVNQSTNMTNNIFLQQLTAEKLLTAGDSQLKWTDIYDPASNYGGLMEDAKVFVMQNSFENSPSGGEMGIRSGGSVEMRQDVMYVVRTGGSSDVPEPASILLWTLGSLGAAGMAYRKRRNSVK